MINSYIVLSVPYQPVFLHGSGVRPLFHSKKIIIYALHMLTKNKHCLVKKLSNRYFESENHLVQEIIEKRHYFLPSYSLNSIRLLKEFDCSNLGIADVIIFPLRKDWRTIIKYGEIPPRWLYALHVLPYRRQFTLNTFIQLTGVSKKRALLALKQYCQLGYCKKSEFKQIWTKAIQPRPVTKKVIAIEAKLKDWKRALAQAYRYSDYASQSWVVLNSSTTTTSKQMVNKFKKLNIGIRIIEQNGKTLSPFMPRFAKPRSALKFWEANGIIAANLLKTIPKCN